jgi:hypothetical protein
MPSFPVMYPGGTACKGEIQPALQPQPNETT